MNSREEKDGTLRSSAQRTLESPFLEEELFVTKAAEEWEAHLAGLAAETPFRRVFEQGRTSLSEPEGLEEEFVEEDESPDLDHFPADDAEAQDKTAALSDLEDRIEELYEDEEALYADAEAEEAKDSYLENAQSLEEESLIAEVAWIEPEDEEVAYPPEETAYAEEEPFLDEEIFIESEEPLRLLSAGAIVQRVRQLLGEGVFNLSLLGRFTSGQIWNEDHLALEILFHRQPRLRPTQLDTVSGSTRLRLLRSLAVKHQRELTPIRERIVRPIFGNPVNFQVGPAGECQIQDLREEVRKLGPLPGGKNTRGEIWYKRDARRSPRKQAAVDSIVLHHMAYNIGNDVNLYKKVGAHYIVTADGQIAQLYDDLDFLNASNGFNPRSVAIEFAGNFPDHRYHWWKNRELPIPDRCYPTPAQIRAGRCLLATLKTRLPGIKYLYAHRQSSKTRANDPGPAVWFNIGEWALSNLNLTDRLPRTHMGTGQPIPENWRMSRPASFAEEALYTEEEKEAFPEDATSPEEETTYMEAEAALDEESFVEPEEEDVNWETFASEQSPAIPARIAEFAVTLGKEWAKRRNGSPPAEKITEWLLQDFQDTLAGAHYRFKKYPGDDSIGRAWMISRQEQMKFQTSSLAGVKPLRNFQPPTDLVSLVSNKSLIQHSDKAPVAPIVVRFVQELRQRYRGSLNVSTYRGHGGGKFKDRGYSIDLFLQGRDDRGFYPPEEAVKFLRALHEAAKATDAEWRVIYNDFSVADIVNRETSQEHVIFVGKVSRDENKKINGLNWHGPHPLILHFHLDLVRRVSAPSAGVSVPSGITATTPKPTPHATKPPAELVRFAQRVLNATEGERLKDDGDLGRLTRTALERFRRKYNLGADGVLDNKTQIALVQRALEEISQQSLFGQFGVLDTKTEQSLVAFKAKRGLGFNATLDAATRAALTDALARHARTPSGALDRIIQVAAESAIARYRWRDRGVAPRGYIKGMALVYARVYCKLKAGDPAATEMAKANTGNTDKDALAHYAPEFNAAGMDNNSTGVDTLRHLFVLLIGLGMRESSGRYCEGRDKSASNTTAETAEAGLFQTSYNARSASPFMPQLFRHYLANPSGFVDVFKEGVGCRDSDLENFGAGDGREFQRLSKSCPAFAAEFAAVGLRNRRKHWGPINRKAAEIRPECDTMLVQVQNVVDEFNLCPELQ